jgi:hypothetical protein
MIIQLDRYVPQVIEFARAYLDYYQDEWKSVPIHRLASLEFRKKLNEGGYDSVELGIGFGYDLSRFNKEAYEQSKKDSRRRYDFPKFDGETILIFLRYLDKHKNYEKEAIIHKFYSELGKDGILLKKKSHKKSMTTSKSGGRKSSRRTRRTRRRTRRTRRRT